MAAPLQASVSEALSTSFADGYFKKAENTYVKTLSDIKALKGYTALGKLKQFPYYLGSPKNFRIGAEQVSTGTASVRDQINGTEVPVEILGFIAISLMLRNIGKEGGTTLNVDELKLQMKEVTEDVTKALQRLFITSHGTSSIGRVLNSVVGSQTVELRSPQFARAIMKGDLIEVYSADSAGSVRASTSGGVKVTAVSNSARTITLASAVTVNADDYIYFVGGYGTAFQGFQGLADDGTFAGSLHGKSRTTYPDLKAKVKDLGGVALADADIQAGLLEAADVDGNPTRCLAGPGWGQAYANITNPDRTYPVAPGQVLDTKVGWDPATMQIQTPWGQIPYRPDPNVDPRTAIFYSPENFRVLRAMDLGWMNGAELLPMPGSGTYSTAFIAMIVAQMNLICLEPWRISVLRNWKDPFGAGDTL